MWYILKNPANKTLTFLTLTLGLSYAAALLFFLSGLKLTSTYGIIFGVSYMFIPALSSFLIEKIMHKNDIIRQLKISFKVNKWFLIAWLLPPFLAFFTLGISFLFPDVSYSAGMEGMFTRFESLMTPEQMEQMRRSMDELPVHPIWITLAQGLFAGLTVNAIAGFGEELGWRGFLVKQFAGMSFIKAALIIGFIWGIWHAPIILMGHNYPQHPEWGVLMMTIWCILLSPLFLYITIKSGSVIAASVMHGTLNGTAGLAILMLNGGNDLKIGLTGFSGFLALILLTLGFFVYDLYCSKEKIMLRNLPKNEEHDISR
jgi:membrane protease YdiL (CAAX protease family)